MLKLKFVKWKLKFGKVTQVLLFTNLNFFVSLITTILNISWHGIFMFSRNFESNQTYHWNKFTLQTPKKNKT